MKMIVCVAVGIIVDLPGDDSATGVCLPTTPIDELAARLRGEKPSHHNKSKPDFTIPGVTAWMATAFQESPERN